MDQWRRTLFVFPREVLILGAIFYFSVAIIARIVPLDPTLAHGGNLILTAGSILLHLLGMLRSVWFMRKFKTDLAISTELAWCVCLLRKQLLRMKPYRQWTEEWLTKTVFTIATKTGM